MIRYTIDTNTVISYFQEYFEDAQKSVSEKSLSILDQAFYDDNIIIFCPSIIFIEIFSKWFKDEESAKRIEYEVYNKIIRQDNFSIEPLDYEVMLNFIKIRNIEIGWNFDNHDKQVLATAMKYNSSLITSDERIERYNKKMKVIPDILK